MCSSSRIRDRKRRPKCECEKARDLSRAFCFTRRAAGGGVDLAGEIGVDAEACREFGEEAQFGGVVAVDGDAGGGVDLQGFLAVI